MKKQLSVISPCYNEEKNIPVLVDRLRKTFAKKNIDGEIILINDASTDSTGQVLDQIAAQYDNVVAVHHEHNKGLFEGWKTGLQRASGKYVCLIDSDLQNLPEDVWRLLREIQQTRADVVQGYRSTVGRLKDSRYFFSRGLNMLLNLAFGMRAQDNKSGFIISYKENLEDILQFRYRYYYPQSFVTVAAHARNYSIREIETLFQDRLSGESFITKNPWRPVFLSFVDLLKAFFEFRVFYKQENVLENFVAKHAPTKRQPPKEWWRKLLLDIYFITLPLHAWMITRATKRDYYNLLQTQWLTPADIKKLQEKKLRLLVRHAYNHVEFYREQFEKLDLTPNDIQTIEDLQKLPFLTKDNVRENLYFGLLSDNHDKRKILKITTSGSTGKPFVCYADRHQLEMRWAATLRSMEWTGYQFGDRQMRLWHQTLGMSWKQIIRERLDALLSRRVFVPAYQMTGGNIDVFIKKMERFKPTLIDGYAESFNFLANYFKQNNYKAKYPPRGIISSAQVLPDQSRSIIEESFGCKVFDKYGSREFSGIAYESDGHNGHLVVAENYIVEIIKDGRPAQPGEVGEVIITDLNNFCMPFIRYRVGDLAVAMDSSQPSACGRGLPRIGTIEGRVQAIIVGANGNYLPGTFFSHLFKDYDTIIDQYKVVQNEDASITIQIVKTLSFDQKIFDEVVAILKRHLGEETHLEFDFVQEIPMVRTGKQQGSISNMKIDFQSVGSALVKKNHKDS